MERKMCFDLATVQEINIRLAWAQLEIFSDDVSQIQVMVAGDDVSVNGIELHETNNVVSLVQPQYGITRNLAESHWLQIIVRVPKAYHQKLDCSTISGLLTARKCTAEQLHLETITGDMRVVQIQSKQAELRTVSGDVHCSSLSAERLYLRTVSGNISADTLTLDTLKSNGITGTQSYSLTNPATNVDIITVSGDVRIHVATNKAKLTMRSIGGHLQSEHITLIEENTNPAIKVSCVSASLTLMGTQA